MEMSFWGETVLHFVAVGRVLDAATLASYSTNMQDTKASDVFSKMLGAAARKLGPNNEIRLSYGEGSICCLMDGQGKLCYCVMTSQLTYPEKLAFQLLHELMDMLDGVKDMERIEANALNEQLQPKMTNLLAYYEDPRNHPSISMSRGSTQSSLGSADSRMNDFPSEPARNNRMLALIGVLVLLVLVAVAVYFFFFAPGDGASTRSAQAPLAAFLAITDHLQHPSKASSAAVATFFADHR